MNEIFENMLTELIHKYGFEHPYVVLFARQMEKAETVDDNLRLSWLHMELMEADLWGLLHQKKFSKPIDRPAEMW